MKSNHPYYRTVVLIPHYNNLSGLLYSIASIRHNEGLMILVVDDGSSPKQIPSFNVVSKFLNDNISLKILGLESNTGITDALNFGLRYIEKNLNAEFIARIDCGDTAVEDRFEIQEKFLDRNQDYNLVGSWVKFKTGGKDIFAVKPPENHNRIQKKMAVRCNFIHPSVMFRTKVISEVGYYPKGYEAAEDYAYFFEIIKEGKAANIPSFLTNVEYNVKGISGINRRIQNKSKLRVLKNYGPRNMYSLYGMFFNMALLVTPSKIVFNTKKVIKGV